MTRQYFFARLDGVNWALLLNPNYLRRQWHSPAGRAKLLKFGAVALFGLIVGGYILTTIVFAVFSIGLPDPNGVIRREGFATIIYDRNGEVLYDLYNGENRIPLQLSEVPKYAQEATISIEDKNFYSNPGFSITGILRSVWSIVSLQGITGGGSTLTQQLVKNVLLSPEQTIFRKIREIILADEINKKFTKDQILQMYLNEIPYGGSAYGIESAAKAYFGVDAKDLNLIQSAILAGLPQSPTYYSPTGANPKAYVARTEDVLRRMREDGYITAQQETDADKQLPNVQFASVSGQINAPHFVFYVKDQLVQQFGEQMVDSGGLRVTTTLDLDLQQQAEQIVNQEVKKIMPLKVSNGAAVVLNPNTGEILSMVGSYDYFDPNYGSYNVTTALRQPGSSGKPFIYATAFQKGYTASSMLMDAKTDYPAPTATNPKAVYTPENYDGKYHGPTQLRFALGNSINTVAVKLTALVGLKDIMTNGFNAGITTWEPTQANIQDVGLSLALGGKEVKLLDLTSAYGVFATGGVRNDPVAILKVTDSTGKVLYEYHQPASRRVFSPEISFLISHILSDNNARQPIFGISNYLVVSGHTVAAKTGTTDQKRDNWTVGYTPDVVAGVWVGNNDNTIMNPAITSGVTGAAPIWNRIMRAALAGKPDKGFKKPDDVVAVTVDAMAGGLPHGSDPTRAEYFIKGTEPTAVSPVYKTLKIAKADGKLANDLEVKNGDYDNKDFIVFSESDPVSADGVNRWQQAINQWVSDNHKSDAAYNPPTDTSDANQNSVFIKIDSPNDHDQVNSNNVEIKAHALSNHDITSMTIDVDGNQVYSQGNDAIDHTVNLSTGAHAIKVHGFDSAGNAGDQTINIGVNVAWDSTATSSARLSPSPLAFL